MRLYLLLVLNLIGTSLAACTISPSSDASTRVCGQKGNLDPAKAAPLRSFRAVPPSNVTYCFDECISDERCNGFYSLAYNPTSGYCTTYFAPLSFQGFKKSNKGILFYEAACYVKKGDCGVSNPSFERKVVGTPPSPSNFQPTHEAANIIPWTFTTYDSANKTYGARTPYGTAKHPESAGDYFMLLNIEYYDGAYLSQTLSLLPNGKYTVEFRYSVLDFTRPVKNVYYMNVGFGGTNDIVVLDPVNNPAVKNHNWVTYRKQFNHDSSNGGSLLINFYPGNTGGPAPLGVFGLDTITVKRV